MTRYLLDTTPLAGLISNRPALVSLITPWLTREVVATSILVYGEVTEYLQGAPDFARRHRELRTFVTMDADFQRVPGLSGMLLDR